MHLFDRCITLLRERLLTTPFRVAAEGLRVLGEFYMNNGQRVALPRAVVDDVRGHLLAARAALPEPEEKKGLLGF